MSRGKIKNLFLTSFKLFCKFLFVILTSKIKEEILRSYQIAKLEGKKIDSYVYRIAYIYHVAPRTIYKWLKKIKSQS